MALTYQESATLMGDFDFRGRIKVACLKFADSIIGELPSTPAHNSRYKWAQQAMQAPEATAQQVQPPTVMDSAVQTAGVDANGKSLITDAALQGSVEAVVGKTL